MPYATHETHFIESNASRLSIWDDTILRHVCLHQQYSIDMDLCDLLQTMKLDSHYDIRKPTEDVIHINLPQSITPPVDLQDELMRDVAIYHSDATAVKATSQSSIDQPTPNVSSTPKEHTLYGCAYLQAVQAQLRAQEYPTTSGEYLDTIFTHREILFSYPGAHLQCAQALSDLAYLLETRAWRADREADLEAVTAFRHEAWVIASQLAPQQS